MSQPKIKVSIICEVYNHEKYLRRCLDGFINQNVNFNYEVLINDDASTDESSLIIKEYVEKYPNIFVPTYQKENLYRYGVRSWIDIQLPLAKGEYIAFCEGDDYWIDPMKLQKQVDFLDSHISYSVTFHRYDIFDETNNKLYNDGLDDLFINNNVGYIDVTTDMFLKRWMTQFLTIVYRRERFDYMNCNRKKYKYFRDSHLIYTLLQNGNGCLMNFVGGVYRRTGLGVYTNMDEIQQRIRQIDIFKELWKVNDDERVKCQYYNSLRIFISNYKIKTKYYKYVLKYATMVLLYDKNIISYLSTIKHIIKNA